MEFLAGTGAVLFGLSLAVASFADDHGPWGVSLTRLLVGGMLVWRGRRHARFRAHYTVVGIVVLACALPPLTGMNVPPLTLLSFLVGVALIVLGIADHCVLRRCLQLAGTVDRPHA
jgi:hypothetical protein